MLGRKTYAVFINERVSVQASKWETKTGGFAADSNGETPTGVFFKE